MRNLIFVVSMAPFTIACASADKHARVCERSNIECHQRCEPLHHHFNQSKLATQTVSDCDLRCDKTYYQCLARQRNAKNYVFEP